MERALFWGLLSFLAAWAGTSIAAVSVNDPNLFQRAGALGIAAAILLFGYQRERVSGIIENIRRREFSDIRTTIDLEAMDAQIQMQDLYLGLTEKSHHSDQGGSEDRALVEKLTTKAAELKNVLSARKADLARMRGENEQLNQRASTVYRSVARQELTVVALATVQTGFGDYAVRLMLGA